MSGPTKSRARKKEITHNNYSRLTFEMIEYELKERKKERKTPVSENAVRTSGAGGNKDTNRQTDKQTDRQKGPWSFKPVVLDNLKRRALSFACLQACLPACRERQSGDQLRRNEARTNFKFQISNFKLRIVYSGSKQRPWRPPSNSSSPRDGSLEARHGTAASQAARQPAVTRTRLLLFAGR